LLFAGQLERNTRCDPDRRRYRLDHGTAEACPGSVGQITARQKPPEGGSSIQPFDIVHQVMRNGRAVLAAVCQETNPSET